MENQTTCPSCGNPIDSSMKFCRSCGTPLGSAPAQTPKPAAASGPVCSKCGTPATEPSQKFCAKCGGPIVVAAGSAAPQAPAATAPSAAASSAAAAAPTKPAYQQSAAASTPATSFASTVAAPAAAGYATPAAGMNATASDKVANARSKFDSFMGASVDTSQVGSDFNSQGVTLDMANDQALNEAFKCFGKAYSPTGAVAGMTTPEITERRKKANEDAAERAAARKEQREFTAREGRVVYGELTSKLQPGVGPTIAMIASEHEKAATQQTRNRLKHNVALGEQSKKEAVEQAERA